MSFGGFLENNTSTATGGGGARIVADISYTNNMPTTATLAHPLLLSTPSLSKSMFNSPGLSLALQQPNIDNNQGVMQRIGESFEGITGRRSREDQEHESRSGSDNMDGASGDDQDAADNPPRKKRYHRHTPQQIQELEAYD